MMIVIHLWLQVSGKYMAWIWRDCLSVSGDFDVGGYDYQHALLWSSMEKTQKGRFDLINVGSGNGLLTSGNKPFLRPMLIQILSPHGVTRQQWVKTLLLYSSARYHHQLALGKIDLHNICNKTVDSIVTISPGNLWIHYINPGISC